VGRTRSIALNLRRRLAHVCLVGLGMVVAGCTAGTPAGTAAPTPTPMPSSAPTQSSATSMQDVMALPPFASLEPGTYFIDPDGDDSTPLRVVYEIDAEGWSQWIGAAKFSDVGHTGVSITTVTNLVKDGCLDHLWAHPPIGPSVDDLATALADLAPFEVTSPPGDVTIYGYRGKHLAWTVPDLPVEGAVDDQRFTGCVSRQLMSWVAFIDTIEGDGFYGYSGPGYIEEFWILDVEGTRVMIAAEQSRDSPAQDVAERDAILDSIQIEP
jgi:hypothetical protein